MSESQTARNATLSDLAALLQDQQARKLDLIVPATKVRAEGGLLVVSGAEPIIDESGVTEADGRYRPTVVADEGVADKLNIPVAYLKRLRNERPDIYDANVNAWLHGDGDEYAPDGRSFLLRTFRQDLSGEGVARAFLSDRFRILDNLDVLTSLLEGVRDSGVETEVTRCDLTDRRMYVRIAAPSVAELAPQLLEGYRSPFTGASGADNPVVFAGFVAANSEVGGGAFTISPQIIVQVCNNGMTITKDVLREVHLGGRLDEGIIRWSADTQQKSLELVSAMAKDAVSTFLDIEYVRQVVRGIEGKASTPITGDVSAAVTAVSKQLKFTEERTAGVLDHFIRGGQLTAGGVAQAITSFAQTVEDADEAAELESVALSAIDAAVKVAA